MVRKGVIMTTAVAELRLVKCLWRVSMIIGTILRVQLMRKYALEQ